MSRQSACPRCDGEGWVDSPENDGTKDACPRCNAHNADYWMVQDPADPEQVILAKGDDPCVRDAKARGVTCLKVWDLQIVE